MTQETAPLAPPAWKRLIALVIAVEGLILVAWALFLVVELVSGRSDNLGIALGSGVILALFAVLMGLLARLWLAGSPRAATPTLVWHVPCLLVLLQLIGSIPLVLVLGLGLAFIAAIAGAVLLILESRP